MNFDPTHATVPEMRSVVEGAVTHRKCPFCESEHWMPPVEDRAFVVSEATVVDGRISDARIEGGAVSWVCGGCGFLRVHVPTVSTPS
jgi:hypothetical protein